MAPAWLEKFIVREDATPDPRRTSERPLLELHYTSLAHHRRILGVQGDTVPRYELKRKAILGGTWGTKCIVTSPSKDNKEIAMLDFHALPRSYMEIELLQKGHTIKIATSKQEYEGSGGLGMLRWKGTGMKLYREASWELRDERGLVVAVTVDERQANGMVSVWGEGLDDETVEELVMVAVAKIEDYKTMLRNSKQAVIGMGAGSTAWLAGSWA